MKHSNLRFCVALATIFVIGVICLCGCTPGNQTDPTTPPMTTQPTTPPATAPTSPEKVPGKIDASCFVEGVTDFEGTIDGVTFTGVLMQGKETTFTLEAVRDIWSYARANGYDGLRVNVHVNQTNNHFTVGTKVGVNGMWTALDIYMGDLDGLLKFASQSTGNIKNHMWFEFINMDMDRPVVNADSFAGEGNTFADYTGTAFDRDITGVKVNCLAQNRFHFTDAAIAQIKSYALEHGYASLRVRVATNMNNGKFVIGTEDNGIIDSNWSYVDMDIERLNAEFSFWSQEDAEAYLTFEFKEPVPEWNGVNYTNFVGDNFTFSMSDDEPINGKIYACVNGKSGSNQSSYHFADWAVDAIKAYAAENDYDILRMLACATTSTEYVTFYGTSFTFDAWYVIDIPINELSSDLVFQCMGGTANVFMCFEFVSTKPQPDPTWEQLDNSNFVSTNFTFKMEADETVNGKTYKCILADGSGSFNFAGWAVKGIKEYAEANGYKTLRVISCCTTGCGTVTINGVSYASADGWVTIDIPVAELSEDVVFRSAAYGWIFMCFEFLK